MLCLHAAQVCERQRGPQAEEPVARLLLQALEAAVHGTLLYRSIQLLVRPGRRMRVATGMGGAPACWPPAAPPRNATPRLACLPDCPPHVPRRRRLCTTCC